MTDTAIEQVRHEPTTIQIIQQVLAEGGKAAEMATVIKELVALKQSEERFAWEREERQARIDFDDALNRCQSAIDRIAPNRKRENEIQWLDYAGLDKVLRPIYSKEGFSVSYSELPPSSIGRLNLRATLSRSGISRDYDKEVPAAAANSKMSQADAEASASSRAKRYLMFQIFNVAVGIDTDEKAPYAEVDNGAFLDWIASIESASTKAEVWQRWEEALLKIAPSGNQEAAKALIAARTKALENIKAGGSR